MRIGFDTHFITSMRSAGGRTYTAELVNALITLDKHNEYVLYAMDEHPFYRRFVGNPRVSTRTVLSRNGLVRNLISLPRAVAQDKLDIIHLQFFLAPLMRTASVLTIHDLYYTHASHPTLYEQALGRLTLKSAQRARAIITVSEYSRQDILRHCRVSESQVAVIPEAIHCRFHPGNRSSSSRDICQKLGIQREYILFVGRTDDSRKNLISLIEAYVILKGKGKINVQLVIAGRHGEGTGGIFDKIRLAGLESEILLPGPITDDDLPILMSKAKVFVYPSSFEGFGLPVLEAMACGTPVITSNSTSLPEVAGDAALFVTPGNAGELAQAIEMLLDDVRLRQQLTERGLRRAGLFSWDQAARKTLGVYESVQQGRKICGER